jgi:uncharacterized protein with FMN-binding domain
MKRIAWFFGIFLFLLVLGGGILINHLAGMAQRFKVELSQSAPVDLARIKNGTYSGNYGFFVVSVSLEVTVQDHKITKIVILKENCGKGYEALATIDRIIQAQSPKVDAVTGASSSSRCIMIAVDRALHNAEH